MDSGYQNQVETEIDMKSQQLKAFCALLFCSLTAQAHPIVDLDLEAQAHPIVDDRTDLDGNLEKSFVEEGVKNPLDHFGTSRNNLEVGEEEGQFATACISFKVVGKKEDLKFLSGSYLSEHINQTFWFSECGGKPNLFETLDDCEKACSSVIDPVHFGCSLPMDEGSCVTRDLPPVFRWFHNPKNGNCEPFWFSGCGGNQNNFDTLDDCEKTCSSSAIGINIPISWIRWD